MQFSFTASLWLRSNGTSPASWHFVTLPKDIATTIKGVQDAKPKSIGFKMVKIQAHIGFCKWETSIFDDKKTGSYLLPIKADIRKQLHIQAGDEVHVSITLLA